MKIEVIFSSGVSRIIECARFTWEYDNTLRFTDDNCEVIAKIQMSQLAGWVDVTPKEDIEPLCMGGEEE